MILGESASRTVSVTYERKLLGLNFYCCVANQRGIPGILRLNVGLCLC